MIFVDSNVFVIALRYPRDRNVKDNAAFLTHIAARGDGMTSVVNVLEVCGVLSSNLNPSQLRALYGYFARRFEVEVLPQKSDTRRVMAATPAELLALLAGRMSFGDALVADALHRWAPAATHFVSWDAKHFKGKIAPQALTPRAFLERDGRDAEKRR